MAAAGRCASHHNRRRRRLVVLMATPSSHVAMPTTRPAASRRYPLGVVAQPLARCVPSAPRSCRGRGGHPGGDHRADVAEGRGPKGGQPGGSRGCMVHDNTRKSSSLVPASAGTKHKDTDDGTNENVQLRGDSKNRWQREHEPFFLCCRPAGAATSPPHPPHPANTYGPSLSPPTL